MAKAKKKMSTKLKEEPVYVWAFQSSKPRAGGNFITYETRLNSDGLTSCNCPGWAFARDGVHSCKHTKMINVEAQSIFQKWKKGEFTEVSYIDANQIQGAALKEKVSTSDSPWIGRVVTLDL